MADVDVSSLNKGISDLNKNLSRLLGANLFSNSRMNDMVEASNKMRDNFEEISEYTNDLVKSAKEEETKLKAVNALERKRLEIRKLERDIEDRTNKIQKNGLELAERNKKIIYGFKKNEREKTEELNDFVSASCLDDRSGVCAILLALDELKKLPCKVTVMFSSQEEVGTRGAKIGPYKKNVDEAIVVDVSFGYTPNCDREDCGEVSKGAMIGFSPILDKTMSRMLVDVAKRDSIPYQTEIMTGKTGTNADVISISESGVKTALISIPEKYMHQPVEVVNIKDIESVSELITAYITERVGEINA